MAICPVEEAIEDIRKGKMVILVDDEDRENEGDLVIAAEFATPEAINFMAKHGRGLICLAITQENANRLNLQAIKPENSPVPQYTAFTIPIDARRGITTGISAYDRASTISLAISEDARPEDFIRPGHVFPLISRRGGVLVRAGHTEGSVDLARLAGLKPAAVICEVMTADGRMARLPDLRAFCKQHGLKMCTIEDLIDYRRRREKLVRREVAVKLPTAHGDFDLFAYTS